MISIKMKEKTSGNVVIGIYFDAKTLETLNRIASKLSISRSAVIRLLLIKYCDREEDSLTEIENHVDSLLSQ